MNNHHDIVYVECPVQESEDWYAKRGLDSIRTPVKPLKDVFVFTKEELINFIDECNKTMDADNEHTIFPFDFITKKFAK